MDRQEVARRAVTAKTHLEFMVKLYQSQLERGAHFPHGHPASAASWQGPSMGCLLNEPGVE
eukprot:5341529-Alexandrium_andersonii.AAC.1